MSTAAEMPEIKLQKSSTWISIHWRERSVGGGAAGVCKRAARKNGKGTGVRVHSGNGAAWSAARRKRTLYQIAFIWSVSRLFTILLIACISANNASIKCGSPASKKK